MATSHNSTPEHNSKPGTKPMPDGVDSSIQSAHSVGRSAALISFFVIISRITGFMRTWAMAFALGSTMLASSYQVANNLPNMLYELVMGGMLVTAFLPVYMSTKQKLGDKGGNEYASNLMSLTFIVLGIVAIICTLFAPALIFTQSFMSDQSTVSDAIFFFRFFAVQIVFYGLSSIVSGLLNASRDYLWSSAAPIFNNIIVTVTFVAYAIVAPVDTELAKFIIAIGNPLGVFVQLAIQLPALKRNGIKLRFHVNLKDPALKETLSIGIPAVIVMLSGLVIVSIQNTAAYAAAENGPSVIAYARLWFTLPYAFLTVPITTTLFTEISDMVARGNESGFKRGLIGGINQIAFLMVPFGIYLIVFSIPLVTLYHIGAFTAENITQIATYLAVLAISLPFYAISTYLQKAFSALRQMTKYTIFTLIAAVAQISFTLIFATQAGGSLGVFGLPAVAFGETIFYAIVDTASLLYLRITLGPLGLKSTLLTSLRAIALGVLGSLTAGAVIYVLLSGLFPMNGSLINAIAVIVIGGIVAPLVTYAPACFLKLPEAKMLTTVIDKITSKIPGSNVRHAKHAR